MEESKGETLWPSVSARALHHVGVKIVTIRGSNLHDSSLSSPSPRPSLSMFAKGSMLFLRPHCDCPLADQIRKQTNFLPLYIRGLDDVTVGWIVNSEGCRVRGSCC